jgi:hypothetical protein
MNRYEIHAALRERRDTLPLALDHLSGLETLSPESPHPGDAHLRMNWYGARLLRVLSLRAKS